MNLKSSGIGGPYTVSEVASTGFLEGSSDAEDLDLVELSDATTIATGSRAKLGVTLSTSECTWNDTLLNDPNTGDHARRVWSPGSAAPVAMAQTAHPHRNAAMTAMEVIIDFLCCLLL